MSPTRPVLRWHGGKWLLGPWIISHFPAHDVYVEPFGGAASVLMQKERAYAEIYNDLLTEPRGRLRGRHDEAVEFNLAYEATEHELERARRLVVRSFMGFGSNGHNIKAKTGFRANSNRSGTTPAHDWVNYPDSLVMVIERLQGVTIENKDAFAVAEQHDAANTLHYFDPPYVPSTRSLANPYDIKYRGDMYAHEMAEEDHAPMLEALCKLEGMVVLSGYASPLYDDALHDWHRVTREALADGARPRTEVLWINQHCWQRLEAERDQLSLNLAVGA